MITVFLTVTEFLSFPSVCDAIMPVVSDNWHSKQPALLNNGTNYVLRMLCGNGTFFTVGPMIVYNIYRLSIYGLRLHWRNTSHQSHRFEFKLSIDDECHIWNTWFNFNSIQFTFISGRSPYHSHHTIICITLKTVHYKTVDIPFKKKIIHRPIGTSSSGTTAYYSAH